MTELPRSEMRPVRSVSPECHGRGASPRPGPTVEDEASRPASSIMVRKRVAVTKPAPGTVISRRVARRGRLDALVPGAQPLAQANKGGRDRRHRIIGSDPALHGLAPAPADHGLDRPRHPDAALLPEAADLARTGRRACAGPAPRRTEAPAGPGPRPSAPAALGTPPCASAGPMPRASLRWVLFIPRGRRRVRVPCVDADGGQAVRPERVPEPRRHRPHLEADPLGPGGAAGQHPRRRPWPRGPRTPRAHPHRARRPARLSRTRRGRHAASSRPLRSVIARAPHHPGPEPGRAGRRKSAGRSGVLCAPKERWGGTVRASRTGCSRACGTVAGRGLDLRGTPPCCSALLEHGAAQDGVQA